MVEKNYTIPINEAFDLYDGCPVCHLNRKLEIQSIDYVMGAAMMEPDVRIETNKAGFCGRHLERMLEMGNRLSLALILESYLNELSDKLGGKAKDSVSAVTCANDGCFVCERMAATMGRYADNIVYLWRTVPEFREKFAKQEFLCLKHSALLLKADEHTPAPRQRFGRDRLPVFTEAVRDVSAKRLDALRDEVSRFCKSFDYRFAGEELGDAAHGVEHAIEWILGNG